MERILSTKKVGIRPLRSPLLVGRIAWAQRYLMLMVIPAIIWMIVFCYIPIYGVVIAFKNYEPLVGFAGSPWVGLRYFGELFTDPNFVAALVNNFKISLAKLLVSTPAPIVFALLLNEVTMRRFGRFVQTVSYLPYFISWVFVVSLLYTLFSPSEGIVNALLVKLRLIREPIFFLGSNPHTFFLIVFSDLWKGFGWNSIIYIAAISTIDPELYEAAIIDGAGRFGRMVYITIPCIMPTILILLIFSVSNLINQNFEQMFLMKNVLNQEATEIIETYTYKIGLELGRFSYATAVGLFKSVVAFVLLYGSNMVSRRTTGHSLF